MTDPAYRLIALCARAACESPHYHELTRAGALVTDWDALPALAEAQGMAPLAFYHLSAADVALPFVVKRQFQALAARHRQANRVRLSVLRDIAAAFQSSDISTIVLKGAALACLVYPEPGLRPMSDLDLLVHTADLKRAQSLLADLGFAVSPLSNVAPIRRHLAAATRRVEGVPVHVELHHRLHDDYVDHVVAQLPRSLTRWIQALPRATSFEIGAGEWAGLQSFAVADVTARTLSREDMLIHLCQHLTSHVNAWDSLRLIWAADVISWAERYAADIDWERLRQQHRGVLNTLSLLGCLTPFSDELRHRARIKIGEAPQGIGSEFQGWPRTPRDAWRAKGYWPVWRDTLYPSEWWLRLRYRLDGTQPLGWYRWVRHPLYILGHAVRASLEKLGWPTFSELMRNPTRE